MGVLGCCADAWAIGSSSIVGLDIPSNASTHFAVFQKKTANASSSRSVSARASEAGQKQANRVPRRLAPCPLAWLFLRDPKHLKMEEKQTLSLICTSPTIKRAYELSQQFVTMLKERDAQPLTSWLRACQTSEISDLMAFVQSLELEGSALQAAFTLSWSNGLVEGEINRLKYIKRSMYGRSGFPLLRRKVLKAG